MSHVDIVNQTQEDRFPFTLSVPLYDQTTYWGRVKALKAAADIRYAFVPKKKVIEHYQKVLEQEAREKIQQAQTGSPEIMLTAAEIVELRHAVNIVKAAIHPDTLQPIPMPMRITFFIPGNIPITLGMIFSKPTMFNTLFWQIANQTYNAVLNLGNANKSSPITNNDIMISYFAAVAASCAAGYTIRKGTAGLLARAKGGQFLVLNAVVSTISCALGGFANNWFIRMPETLKGIEVQDPATGQTVGTSKLCAKSAVLQTAFSRILMALPLAFPGFTLYAMERKGLAPKNPALLLALQMSLVVMQLTAAVPLSMGAFPQICDISAHKLEEEFQNIRSEATGELIKEFRYNKGL